MKQLILYIGLMLAMATGLFIVYYNSGRFSNTYGDLKKEMEYRYEKKDRTDSGTWYSNKWEMYHTLSFEPEKSITIDNHIDTIFHFKYTLNKDTLWLFIGGEQRIPNKIKMHSSKELVFESFLEEKKELRYSRTKNLSK